jgi:hypothetical protein
MKRIITLCILMLTFCINAQETGEDQLGAWYMYFGTNKIADKLSVHSEAQFRYYETTSNFNQLLLRTGLNYHMNEDTFVTFGYAYIDTDPTFEDASFLGNQILEHRIFEQLILKNKLWEFLIEHRY